MNYVSTLLGEGQAALADGDWEGARGFFEQALLGGDSAEGHAGLGKALWWLGDLTGSIEHRERSYALYRHRGELVEAFANALLVALDYQGHVGNRPAAAGWLARAERLVDESGIDELRGWISLVRAGDDGDPAEAEQHGRRALDVARATNDLDLELCALSRIGARLVEQGRVAEGIPYLDEAMAGSLGGEGDSRDTVVLTSCNMMVSCIGAADFDRAVRWVQAADRFAKQYGCPFLYAECRTIYGSVLFSTGDWEGADRELHSAIASSKDSVPVFHAQALAALAELRLAQGRLAEARRLVSGVEDHPWAVPVVARMHLLAERPAAAEAVIDRAMRSAEGNRLQAANLRELLGEAAIARAEHHRAVAEGERLVGEGDETGCRILAVRGHRLLGRAFTAMDDETAAIEHLEAARAGFVAMGMVYEAAVTGLALGEILAVNHLDVAIADLHTSLETLQGLGARREADRAAKLLRERGVRAGIKTGPRSDGPLTEREGEVLELLGEGLTNPEIAERLFISRKTVEHHVASVLAKLGLRNRAEAAAEAVRQSSS